MREGGLRRLIGSDLALINPAWLCVAAGLVLSVLGLYAIDVGQNDAPERGLINITGLVRTQGAYLGVALVAMLAVAAPHFKFLRLLTWPLLAVCVGLLVFLLIPWVPSSVVRPRNGARAWIDLGFIDFQPGELAKIAVILALSEYLRFRSNHRTWAGLIPPAVIAGVPMLLIARQPDLGMALNFAPALLAMLLVAGAKMKHLILVILIAMLGAPVAYPMLKPHQKARIEGLVRSYQDPTVGAEGIMFQSLRSQALAGAGQLAGVSDAKARALHKYNALPERHNDMIIAVVLTRFGLIGGLAMFFLYALWFAGAYLTAATSKDAFGQLVVVGCMAMLFAQAFINAAMALGLLPIIGITLPFVSYGGTSLVTNWVMTGLVLSVALRRPSRLSRPTFEFDSAPYDPKRSDAGQRVSPSFSRRA